MNGYSAENYSLSTGSILVGASAALVVSKDVPVTAGGSKNMVVAIDVSAVTVGSGITARLETAIGSVWETVKSSAAITTADRVYIRLNVQDPDDIALEVLPLLNKVRVVMVTTAGSAISLDAVYVLQDL